MPPIFVIPQLANPIEPVMAVADVVLYAIFDHMSVGAPVACIWIAHVIKYIPSLDKRKLAVEFVKL